MSSGVDGKWEGWEWELQSQHQRQCVSAHEVENLYGKGSVLVDIKKKQNSSAAKPNNSPKLPFNPAKETKLFFFFSLS